MQSIDNKIVSRIYGKKRGWVFTPKDFVDLGSRPSVDVALHRRVKSGTIQRIARGLYYYPKQSLRFGVVPPSADEVINAVARRDNVRLQVSGAHAANMLGLTEQVPVKSVYYTDGRAQKI